ncbi:MAG: ATP-grasp domain-containing protein [Bacteroidetes bacterium]|nr:ATP-grasp domain-containing protein [Bacteroidota bacterium]
MKIESKILICFNAPVSIFSVYNGKPLKDNNSEDDLSEKSFLKELNNVKRTLKKHFTQVETLAIDRDVQKTINGINSFSPDVIFNFVESVEGVTSFEYCLAGLFELLGFEYTGCRPISLGNCLDKARTKEILRSFGIKTPNFIKLKPNEKFSKKDISLSFPIILKLLTEDASIGVSEFSVVNTFTELRKHFKFLSEIYIQEIILEEYIEGRELNVAILDGKPLPVSEIDFTGLPAKLPKIVTYDGKWIESSIYYNHTKPICPANLSKRTLNKINKVAMSAFKALECRDYARIDIRLSSNGIPFVIEVNPNPDVSTDSGFARAALEDGVNHSELLLAIANFALKRKLIHDTQVKAG